MKLLWHMGLLIYAKRHVVELRTLEDKRNIKKKENDVRGSFLTQHTQECNNCYLCWYDAHNCCLLYKYKDSYELLIKDNLQDCVWKTVFPRHLTII